MLEAFLAHDVADPDKVHILGRYFNRQIPLSHLELEVHLLFALDGAHFDLFDLGCTVVGVNNRLANLKNHVDIPLSRRLVYHVHPALRAPGSPEIRGIMRK
ncbi:hypothetical protein GCM10012320_04490 [Sinomonas cellulolyticus]|nr:hypothetical protein GCM10012320_04490 [Sinomonas sp. KCTC 49339]